MPSRYYTSYSCTHSEIDAARELTMNRKIVTPHCICGVGWFVHYKVLTSLFVHNGALIDGKQVILSSSISSHYTAVVDMTVVTTKNLLRLIYLDTEQHLFSDLPYWFSDGNHSGVTS